MKNFAFYNFNLKKTVQIVFDGNPQYHTTPKDCIPIQLGNIKYKKGNFDSTIKAVYEIEQKINKAIK